MRWLIWSTQEGMATILAMVNAEKEGQIESKMMKARQLEEIRDAKRAEAAAKQAKKKSKLVCCFLSFATYGEYDLLIRNRTRRKSQSVIRGSPRRVIITIPRTSLLRVAARLTSRNLKGSGKVLLLLELYASICLCIWLALVYRLSISMSSIHD